MAQFVSRQDDKKKERRIDEAYSEFVYQAKLH